MCDFSKYPQIPYPYPDSPVRTIESLLDEARDHIKHGRKDDAHPILVTLQRHFTSDNGILHDVLDELWDQCGYPRPANITPYNEDGGATNNDNRPPGYELDKMVQESKIPTRKKAYPKITLNDDFKEKMLKFIFLTQRNSWYKLRNSNQKPSNSDVFYWYGVLFEYQFDNKTSKLYEAKTKDEIKALAQEFQSFAHELQEMAEKNFKLKK